MSKLLVKLKAIFRGFASFLVGHFIFKITLYWYTVRRARTLWKHLPGKDVDVFGTSLRNSILTFFDYLASDPLKEPDKDLFKLPLPEPAILCYSPAALEWSLSAEFDHVDKLPQSEFGISLVSTLLGTKRSLFLASHEPSSSSRQLWSKHRRLIIRYLSANNCRKQYLDVIDRKCDTLIDVINSSESDYCNIQELFKKYTMDLIEENLFGQKANSLESGETDIFKVHEDIEAYMGASIVYGIPIQHIAKRFLPFPFGSLMVDSKSGGAFNLLSYFYLKYSSHCRKYLEATTKMHRIADEYIQKAKADPKIKDRHDLLASLINADEATKYGTTELRGIILSLMLAGRDTVGSTLSWFIFELTQNLEVQEQLIKEIDLKITGEIKFEDLSPDNLPYLNGVLYEVLRLHPPLLGTTRLVRKDLVYHDGTKIPKGTRFVYQPYASGRNPLRYPSPLELKPERWIPFEKPSNFDFPIFLAGERDCPGRIIALFQAKFTIVRLLQKFQFELKEGEAKNISYALGFFNAVTNDPLKKTKELWIKSKLRTHNSK